METEGILFHFYVKRQIVSTHYNSSFKEDNHKNLKAVSMTKNLVLNEFIEWRPKLESDLSIAWVGSKATQERSTLNPINFQTYGGPVYQHNEYPQHKANPITDPNYRGPTNLKQI